MKRFAMLLAAVGIRLVEGHAMAAIGEGANQTAVVGRSPVPVGRHQARSEERNVEAGAHASTSETAC